MFLIILFLFVAFIINCLVNDLIKDTQFALTSAGMNMSFAFIVFLGGFWNPILWWVTATVLLSLALQEFNGHVYNV